MKKPLHTVRVIWYTKGPQDQSGLLIEQLRYMGLVNVLADFTPILPSDHTHDRPVYLKYEGYYVLEFVTPKGLNENWARQNADRICSFGVNAVVAPMWATSVESLRMTIQKWAQDQRDKSHVDGNQ